jgi:hypothetical protein
MIKNICNHQHSQNVGHYRPEQPVTFPKKDEGPVGAAIYHLLLKKVAGRFPAPHMFYGNRLL